LGRSARLHALPFTPLAQDAAFHVDAFFNPGEHFLQGEGDGVAQVRPELGPAGPAAPAASQAEKIFKNVPETAENVLKAAKTADVEAI
jgi:hypothetical protein